ncbi:hypothetical protein [Mesorhizobium sp. CO1-1-8]|uniref:hypothetical protein n=1 Tax=Mesorhizobium sp. CO1-1-8 TaxID=2876631 RepID=UPI001CD07C1F|nr:hypothetical protein [Mesorhizobium sp. CO1-1-8]MBZ9772545.1 hypothetical protein [Mesorhizobium sp. CO1-1-8]
MQKIFVIHNLLPGVTREQFDSWSREVDQGVMSRRDGCIRYEVYYVEGDPTGGEPFCHVVEDIDVEDVDRFMASLKTPEMERVMASFKDYGDISSVRFVVGSKINPARLPSAHSQPGS